jgi:hypothetical protein
MTMKNIIGSSELSLRMPSPERSSSPFKHSSDKLRASTISFAPPVSSVSGLTDNVQIYYSHFSGLEVNFQMFSVDFLNWYLGHRPVWHDGTRGINRYGSESVRKD